MIDFRKEVFFLVCVRSGFLPELKVTFNKKWLYTVDICGQSYKRFTLVNYDSRAVITSKLLIFTTLESKFMLVKAL